VQNKSVSAIKVRLPVFWRDETELCKRSERYAARRVVVAIRNGNILAVSLVFAALASPATSRAEDANDHERSNHTVTSVAVAQEISALKLAGRKDVCLAVSVENELQDPPSSLLESPPLIGFGLHKLSWCAPRCHDNPKAGELPDLICDKMPRGITIRVSKVLWSSDASASVLVETDDNSLKKADLGLILRKGNYKVAHQGNGQWRVVGYKTLSPCNPRN
jgi:hypothetical protein